MSRDCLPSAGGACGACNAAGAALRAGRRTARCARCFFSFFTGELRREGATSSYSKALFLPPPSFSLFTPFLDPEMD